MKYVCVKKCYHGERLWTPGETLESKVAVENRHFKLVSTAPEDRVPETESTEARTAEDDLLS